MTMPPADRGPSVLAQLKQDVADLKASCLQLANQPKCVPDMQRLEREVQQSRRHYDELLERRRKQNVELENLFTRFQELQLTSAAAQEHTPAHRQVKQLQTQLTSTTAQLHEALDTQQQYQNILQQLKQGHLEFQPQLDKIRADVAEERERVTKAKAQLLKVQHARDAAKRDIAAAEVELASGRAKRATLLQHMTATCHAHLQQQLKPQQLPDTAAPAAAMKMEAVLVPAAAAARSNVLSCTTLDADSPPEAAVDSAGGALQCLCDEQSTEIWENEQRLTGVDFAGGRCASAVECLQQLLSITGCSSEEDLMVHVQAHLQAAVSLQEVAVAAAEKLGSLECY